MFQKNRKIMFVKATLPKALQNYEDLVRYY